MKTHLHTELYRGMNVVATEFLLLHWLTLMSMRVYFYHQSYSRSEKQALMRCCCFSFSSTDAPVVTTDEKFSPNEFWDRDDLMSDGRSPIYKVSSRIGEDALNGPPGSPEFNYLYRREGNNVMTRDWMWWRTLCFPADEISWSPVQRMPAA